MPREVGQPAQGRAVTLRENDLKICDLCGGLNLDANAECFVCGWRGRFERDPEVVRAAIELAMREHGKLEFQHITGAIGFRSDRRFAGRIASWFRRLSNMFRSRASACREAAPR